MYILTRLIKRIFRVHSAGRTTERKPEHSDYDLPGSH